MSILFILPHEKIKKKQYIQTHPPLGISYLISYLKSKNISCHGIDLSIDNENSIYKLIENHKIEYVGLTVNFRTLNVSVELSKIIKQKYPNITIIWGGPFVHFVQDYVNNNYLDFIILGEGEETLEKIINESKKTDFRPYEIPNIVFSYEKKAIQTPREASSIPLDKLPFPDREWLDLSKYSNPLITEQCYITGSRYCPHNCSFCINAHNNNPYRIRSVNNIVEEIRFIKKNYPQYKRFLIVDETLNTSEHRLINFCNEIAKEKIQWICNIRAEKYMTKKENLQLIKNAGNILINIGIESGSEEILKTINKDISLNNIQKILEITTSLKMPVVANFMIPHVQDTIKTVQKTMDFMTHLANKYLTIPLTLRTTIFPTKENSEIINKYGIIINDLGEIQRTKNIPYDLLNLHAQQSQELKKMSSIKHAQQLTTCLGLDMNAIIAIIKDPNQNTKIQEILDTVF